MDQTWYQHFEAEIQTEIDSLFIELCEKKQRIWSLVSEYLEEENEFQNFLDQYEAFFQQPHMRIANLTREEFSLKRKLQDLEDSDGILDLGGLLGKDNKQEEEETEAASDTTNTDKNKSVSFFNFERPEVDNENETIKLQKARESLKKQVARTFLWIYHPKRMEEAGDDFLSKRSGLVTRLMNNPLYDATEIILRIPFAQRDRNLWEQPLPRQGSDGNTESVGDRWYRYKLWNRMLDVALPKAEAIASSPPHDLYPHYLEMKRRGIQMIFYFQELEVEKNREIEALEQKVAKLRHEINQRGGK
jgi:hypothetical protein